MEAPTLLRDLHWTPLEGPGRVSCFLLLIGGQVDVPFGELPLPNWGEVPVFCMM